MGKPEEIRYLTPDEVEQRIRALTPADCLRLERLGRGYAWGSSWTAEDLRQEAIEAALCRRQWRADLTTIAFLVGAMKSIAHSKRKSASVAHLDLAMVQGDMGTEELTSVEHGANPAQVLEEEQGADLLLTKLMAHFANDPEVQRVIKGRMAGEAPAAIKGVLGLNQSQYETVCRRLTREYHNIKVEKS